MQKLRSKKFKVVMLGQAMTGKTSIAHRLVSGQQYMKQMPTIGVQYHNVVLDSEEQSVEIDLWDTSGQERYRSIGKMHYRDADVIILVYDMSEDDSAEKLLKMWFKDVSENVNIKQVIIILIGNKADIADKSNTYIGRRAKQLSLSSFEVSAKTGQGFTQFKRHLVHELCRKKKEMMPQPELQHRTSVLLHQSSNKQRPNECIC